MKSARGVTRMAVAVALLLVAGVALADAHALWPTDWNNWSDPALWVPVGNPVNAGEWSGESYGGNGADRVCGAVDYAYNIGKYEVTAGQYTAFLNAVAATDTYGLYSMYMADPVNYRGCNIQRSGSGTQQDPYAYSIAADWANRPVNFVSWGDAARFANWLTNDQPTGAQGLSTTEDGSYYLNGATTDAALTAITRKTPAQGGRYYIPTEDEWYKAAYHKNDGVTGNYFDYPTGTDSTPSKDLVSPDEGNNANFMVLVGSQPAYTIGNPYYRTLVGEFENSESPYDTFDQGGNVWEWNEAIIFTPSATRYEFSRALRGGAFYGYKEALHAAERSGDGLPNYEEIHVGFRVSEVPEPATLALLAVGGLLLIRRRAG